MWCFFDEIDDVPTLTAIEEQGEVWEALLDGDRLGMAVVDTVEMPFVSRLAVTPNAQRIDITTAILDRPQDEYSRLRCRVHKENLAGIRLVESTGFHRKQEGHHSELRWYDIQVNDIEKGDQLDTESDTTAVSSTSASTASQSGGNR
ncbi:N-acetyltransferase [Halosimplex salinum]|uniref:hypothetical protein n=1 Tax=Halosimplex salinum TaxID=1710538 RepID=UPI000F4A198C|nr:hypothetical protein [Halosimplex salinum]